MVDQRKLAPLDEPNVDLQGRDEPRFDASEMGSVAGRLNSLDRSPLEPTVANPDQDTYLPPLPAKDLPQQNPVSEKQAPVNSDSIWVRKVSGVILVLMTGSLAGFITGVAGGVLLFTGILDIDSAWIKNVVDIFRG